MDSDHDKRNPISQWILRDGVLFFFGKKLLDYKSNICCENRHSYYRDIYFWKIICNRYKQKIVRSACELLVMDTNIM